MANTQYGLFSYSVIDEFGTKSTIAIPVMVDPTTGTPAALKTEWTTMGGLVDALITGQIVGGRILLEFPPDGAWKSAPVTGSRLEQTGLFNFLNATTKYKFAIDVGSLDNTVIDAGKIDLTNTDVIDFINEIVSAFTGGVFTNVGQYPLTALADAAITFRKHRKQLSRSSFEPG